MIAQQLLGLVQELALVLRPSRFISPPQLPQKLCPCRLTHCFIHSGHGNPTSGATYPLTALSTPSRVTKLLAQFVAPLAKFIDWYFLQVAAMLPSIRKRASDDSKLAIFGHPFRIH